MQRKTVLGAKMDYRHLLINLIVLTIAAIFILLWMRRDQQAGAAKDSQEN